MKWLLVWTLCLPVFALEGTKQEVIQRYKLRYEDFFKRQRQEEARDRKRRQGLEEVKEERQRIKEMHERARKQYVASRPPPKDDSNAFFAYLKEQENERKKFLERQRRYSQMKTEIERVKRGAIKIPPVLEFGLENAL